MQAERTAKGTTDTAAVDAGAAVGANAGVGAIIVGACDAHGERVSTDANGRIAESCCVLAKC